MLWLVECSGWFKWLSWNYRRDLHAINHPSHQHTASNINAKQFLVLPNIWETIIQQKIKTPYLSIFTCYSALKPYTISKFSVTSTNSTYHVPFPFSEFAPSTALLVSHPNYPCTQLANSPHQILTSHSTHLKHCCNNSDRFDMKMKD